MANSQQEPHQQQDVNVTPEISAQRRRGKRARSVEASSLNPSISASRKSQSRKYSKSEEGEVLSSAVKQKTSMVEHRARTANCFRSPVMPCRSTGMRLMFSPRLMLSPRLILSPTPSPPPDTIIWLESSGLDIDIELTRDIQRYGIISVLFETPSGFAIFIMHGGDLNRPGAMKDTWAFFGLPDRVEKNLMHFLVPQEKMKFRNEDRIPMSRGLKMLLNRYGFDVKPEMVKERIIMMACILIDCEFCDEKHSKPLRMAGANLKDLSGIDSEDWDLMKLVTALKIICYPAETTISEAAMFTQDEVKTFVRDAHKYKGKIYKDICLNAYYEIVRARKNRAACIRKSREYMSPAYEG